MIRIVKNIEVEYSFPCVSGVLRMVHHFLLHKSLQRQPAGKIFFRSTQAWPPLLGLICPIFSFKTPIFYYFTGHMESSKNNNWMEPETQNQACDCRDPARLITAYLAVSDFSFKNRQKKRNSPLYNHVHTPIHTKCQNKHQTTEYFNRYKGLISNIGFSFEW